MLRRKSKLWMLTMSLGVGAVVQCGCDDPLTTIKMIPSPLQPGILILNPQQGQTIRWTGVTPIFSKPIPCDPPDPSTNGVCKVKETSGIYLYHCANTAQCTDPEVVVGSDPGIRSLLTTTPAPVAPNPISLYCDSNQVTLDPADVPIAAPSGTPIQVSWPATGNSSQKIGHPQVTFTGTTPPGPPPPLPACSLGQNGTTTYVTCNFNAPAANTQYQYTANSSAQECNQTSAKGTLTVTVQ